MIVGLGNDVCPVTRWTRLVDRHGDRAIQRILSREEEAYLRAGHPGRLPERLAGRWALREAFGKALGTGMDGWSWRELRFQDGRLWAEGSLSGLLAARGITRLHGTVAHDGGIAFAVVILESDGI